MNKLNTEPPLFQEGLKTAHKNSHAGTSELVETVRSRGICDDSQRRASGLPSSKQELGEQDTFQIWGVRINYVFRGLALEATS